MKSRKALLAFFFIIWSTSFSLFFSCSFDAGSKKNVKPFLRNNLWKGKYSYLYMDSVAALSFLKEDEEVGVNQMSFIDFVG